MSEPTTPTRPKLISPDGQTPAASGRLARQAAALRENLRKRKQQARERASDAAAPSPQPPAQDV